MFFKFILSFLLTHLSLSSTIEIVNATKIINYKQCSDISKGTNFSISLTETHSKFINCSILKDTILLLSVNQNETKPIPTICEYNTYLNLIDCYSTIYYNNYIGPFKIIVDNEVDTFFKCENDFMLYFNKFQFNDKIGHSLINDPGIPNIYNNKINYNNNENGFFNVNYTNNLSNIKIPNFYSSNKKIECEKIDNKEIKCNINKKDFKIKKGENTTRYNLTIYDLCNIEYENIKNSYFEVSSNNFISQNKKIIKLYITLIITFLI